MNADKERAVLFICRFAAFVKRNVRVIVTGEINLDAHCFKLLFNFQRQLEVIVFFVAVAVCCAYVIVTVSCVKANVRVTGVGVFGLKNSASYADSNDDSR